jgi:hypothetical protein
MQEISNIEPVSTADTFHPVRPPFLNAIAASNAFDA